MIKATEDTIGSQSKVERYGWRDLHEPGKLTWVDKREVQVDHEYQRDLNEKKVKAIAARFSWPAFGVLIVARRGSDGLFAVDGQHRLVAARRRTDVHQVPCIVFDSADSKTEAVAFIESNTLRKPVSSAAKFKAMVHSGNELAIRVNQLIVSIDREASISASSKTIACISTFLRLCANPRSEKALRAVLPVLADAFEGEHLGKEVIDGCVYLELHIAAGESLASPRWAARIRRTPAVDLLHAARRGAQFHAKGGPRAWSEGLLQSLNKGVPESKRLRLQGDDDAAVVG